MEPEIHPGHYVVKILRPAHNGGDSYPQRVGFRNVLSTPEPLFENILRRDKVLYWDQYEDFILSWCKTIRRTDVAITRSQSYIAAWEMLLRCFDDRLASYGRRVSNKLFATIDLQLSERDRCSAIRDSLSYCADNVPLVYQAWIDKMDYYLGRRCGWLAELITRNGIDDGS